VVGTVVDGPDGAPAELPAGTQLVVTSPGWPPSHPLFASAAALGIPIWGDVELAWRLSRDVGTRWLVVTGTNGKTTTTEMAAAILAAAGVESVAAGNIGTPLLDVVRKEPPYDVIAVELSSFQLHWAPSLEATAAVVLNVAADHLDWHGSRSAYAAAKARAFEGAGLAIGVAHEAGSMSLLEDARTAGVAAVVVELGPPAPGELGIVADRAAGTLLMVDRAFGPGVPEQAEFLLDLADVSWPMAPHFVTDALAAAALTRAVGVTPEAVGAALAEFVPGAHRMRTVAEHQGIRWVDDSKATNPHAAAASLGMFERVVWLAGGRNKGLEFDDLVREAAVRLSAVVLFGEAADELASAFARHAPQILVVRVAALDDGVRTAARLAQAGDTVLLAPAAASMDQFRDYAERGEAFAAQVRLTITGTADGTEG
jgi:UDP-N-acetylmuramoylalanine--D-glutamate ligase